LDAGATCFQLCPQCMTLCVVQTIQHGFKLRTLLLTVNLP
jgi:hypothetical protein